MTNDLMGKLFTVAMFQPDGTLCVEVDGKTYELSGDIRTEGKKIILQTKQEEAEEKLDTSPHDFDKPFEPHGKEHWGPEAPMMDYRTTGRRPIKDNPQA